MRLVNIIANPYPETPRVWELTQRNFLGRRRRGCPCFMTPIVLGADVFYELENSVENRLEIGPVDLVTPKFSPAADINTRYLVYLYIWSTTSKSGKFG